MGDWCGARHRHFEIEITGAGKEALITMAEETPNVTFARKNKVFSLNGEVYLLTKGLLMGDPFSVTGIASSFTAN